MDAGTYVRVGSTNRRADAALTAEMQRFARGKAFDERAMPDIDSEAVSFRALPSRSPPYGVSRGAICRPRSS
ncbi:MAG: hypothetical protein ACREUL_04595 [Steroidobacteraceae bacterium]